jgi:cysteine-rich repeat protein
MTRLRASSTLRLVPIVAIAVIFACLEAESTDCPNGLVCPPGTQCAAAQNVCISDGCGNGILDDGEVCDDGNIRSGDGCSFDCLSDETCGNGIVDIAAGEVCDDGNNIDGDGCSADCRSNELCGNGIVDVAIGEVCDDGNNIDGDGCSADCLSTEVCGNGIIDIAVGEVCDDGNTSDGPCAGPNPPEECAETCNDTVPCPFGFFCSDEGRCDGGDGCSADCRSGQACGNGIRDPEEDCDDAGESAKCNADCTFRVCGDGKVNATAGEQCDDGGESADCNVDCTFQACGDGKVNATAGEQCDNLGAVDSATCNANCTVAFCGDLYVNEAAGEECDEGVTSTCNHDCTFAVCGDGIVNPLAGEQCDPPGPTCNADCTVSFCGDGKVNPLAGEECDDGGFSETCNIDCTFSVCGDGIVNPAAGEECDDGDDTDPADGCHACKLNRCGDGIVKPPEVCDDGNANACGQCSATCDAVVTPAPATGSIVAVRGNVLVDGTDTFTIDDGFGTVVTFEFDSNEDVTPGHVGVPFANGVNAATMAARIATAINGSALLISATQGTDALVILTHQRLSSLGNVPLVETVADASFAVSGMSGGAAGDCPAGTGCTSADDCASGSCTGGTCD